MSDNETWYEAVEDKSAIKEVIESFPIDTAEDNAPLRSQVMTAALEWAVHARPEQVALALSPLPRAANSDHVIRELEKRDDFRAFQKWWFDTQKDDPLSFELYMDWIEALRLLWKRMETE